MQIYEELVARGLIAQTTDESEIKSFHCSTVSAYGLVEFSNPK